MASPHRFFAILALLAAGHTTAFGQVAGKITSQQNETWPCVCDPGGLIGTQLYTGDEKQGFTQCSCLSVCPLCPAGEILDMSEYIHDKSCACGRYLFVIVRLSQLRLSNYTLNIEKTFVDSLASLLQLASSQIIPGGRRNGSVILDMYISSTSQSQRSLGTVASTLLKKNKTEDNTFKIPLLGPWKVTYVSDLVTKSGQDGLSGKEFNGRLLVVVLLLCATITVALLLTSLVLLHYKKTKTRKLGNPLFWFDEDSNMSGFRSLINHGTSRAESFQVYDNSCFHGGCIGRRSFKSTSKLGPLLGTVTWQFSYSELQEATGGFCKSNIIGTGGSSTVYRGQLKDGRDVAIKKLTSDFALGLDREFLLEVELLSRLHHFHLVPLIGYCFETHGGNVVRILVYEFMPNGNLREHLNHTLGKETLNWTARLRIALGAARGLEYLHEAADPRVLHRDFKSNNLLLDAKWRAKVADFGMATTVKEADCTACPNSPAQMLGTFGYFAPEYAMMGRATVKSDVFSFGVVLLELLSGRKPVDKSLPPSQESLVVWALPLLHNTMRLVTELVDPALHRGLPVEDAQKMAHLAWLCLQMDPESRPTMTFAVQLLATLIPENSTNLNDFGSLMEQAPQLLPWAQDYSFSRQDEMHTSVLSLNVLDLYKLPSRRFSDRHGLVLDGEQELMQRKGEPNRQALSSTSLSAAEYLEKFAALAYVDTKRKAAEDDADLVKPRMEYFWQNNGLMAQVESPAR